MKQFTLVFFTILHAIGIEGTCGSGCKLPITVYNDLKCVPEYNTPDDCCPVQYDCSHIYNRTENTCHFKGKLYKSDERIKDEDISGSCQHSCRCQTGLTETHIFCPRLMDGCAEYWVSGYVKPMCYLKHDLNHCCATGQICPPFDDIQKCEVNEKTYKEGERFNHPKHKCIECVCKKGFEGKFKKPFCQEVKCYSELKYSGAIDDHCAPYYESSERCCPNKWICPTHTGKLLPPLENNAQKEHLKCKFGKEVVSLGHRYEEESEGGKIYCECVVPPLMTCGPQPFKV